MSIIDTKQTRSQMIEAYFEEQGTRIDFLQELNACGKENEALMLCCCYIEAIGNRQYGGRNHKKNFSKILESFGGNELFAMVHPLQIIRTLETNGVFREVFQLILETLQEKQNELITQEETKRILGPFLNEARHKWLEENIYKFTFGAISYEEIRSELVHDMSVFNLTFSGTSFKGEKVPDLNFNILFPALQKIHAALRDKSLAENLWPWDT